MVVDLETTGLYPNMGAKIIEIVGVGILNLKLKEDDFFQSFVNPWIPIPSEITLLNGITDEMVKNARGISEVLPEFLDFLKDSPIIAHNAEFELKFLNLVDLRVISSM